MAQAQPSSAICNLKVYYENVNLFTTEKYHELQIKALLENYDVIALSAIKRQDDEKLNVPLKGYKHHFSPPLPDSRGIVIYVKQAFESASSKVVVLKQLRESWWVEVIEGENKVLIGVVYRNHELPAHFSKRWLENLIKALRYFALDEFISKIIVGNFNLPTIKWTNGVGEHIQRSNWFQRSFINIVNNPEKPLYQHVNFPTVGRDGYQGTDCLVFTEQDVKLSDIASSPPLDYNQHLGISFTIPNTSVFHFKRRKNDKDLVNYKAMTRTLEDPEWLAKLEKCNTQDAYRLLLECILIERTDKKKALTNKNQNSKWTPVPKQPPINGLRASNLQLQRAWPTGHQNSENSFRKMPDSRNNRNRPTENAAPDIKPEYSQRQKFGHQAQVDITAVNQPAVNQPAIDPVRNVRIERALPQQIRADPRNNATPDSNQEHSHRQKFTPDSNQEHSHRQKFTPDSNQEHSQRQKFRNQAQVDITDVQPTWANKQAINAVRQKMANFKKKDFADSCKNTKSHIAKSYKEHEKLTEENVREFINKHKAKTEPQCFVDDNGVKVSNPRQMCEMLSDHYAKSFTREDTSTIPLFEPIENIESICDIEITEGDIEDKLQEIGEKKSGGPDGVRPALLHRLGKSIFLPLKIIFEKSLANGEIPIEWKEARIQPNYKQSGDPEKVVNYRPISITSTVCKILEKIIKDKLVNHLERFDLQSVWQHGHRGKRSSTTSVIETIHCWADYLSHDIPVDVIYLDFRKAFDSVPHQRLLCKLQQYGITGNLFNWIKCFISNRKQRVMFMNSASSWQDVVSGVMQGTVLSGILFMIFVNDVPRLVKNRVSMFVDDIKIYAPQGHQYISLQQDLDTLYKWSYVMQLPFNGSKCKVLHLGTNNMNKVYHYTDKDGQLQDLDSTELQRDLGVYIDRGLTFDDQVDKRATETEEHMTTIFNATDLLDPRTFKIIYQTDIISKLLYACCVWFPNHKKDEDRLERVQELATKQVKGMERKNYEERLRLLELPTVKFHKVTLTLIEMYRILTDEISLCLDTHCSEKNCDARILLPLYPPDVGHGACVKPQKLDDHPMADLMFAGKVRDIWNALPEDVIHCDTVDDFREALIKLRMKDPDCYKYEFTTYHHNSHRPKSSHPVNRQQDRKKSSRQIRELVRGLNIQYAPLLPKLSTLDTSDMHSVLDEPAEEHEDEELTLAEINSNIGNGIMDEESLENSSETFDEYDIQYQLDNTSDFSEFDSFGSDGESI